MRNFILLIAFTLVIILTACSASESDKKADFFDSPDSESSSGFESGQSDEDFEMEEIDEESGYETERKIIHRAYLSVNVSNFEKSQQYIENKVEQFKGYIVETNVYSEDEYTYGSMIVRIPANDFRQFITDIEENSNRVIDRTITGDDVTEQYVDLQSRLKSKRIVEERLLQFLSEAEKTEDLLKISSDLSVVQEEIELLVGKINYLKNQVDFSTVEVNLYEDRIVIPGIDSKGLNTWEKTKQQFLKSINFLLAFSSSIFVFFFGNILIFALIALGVFGLYYLIQYKLKKRSLTKEEESNHNDEE